ncbi:MAG: zinc ABC transporter substrate-binding protein [Paenisporosarcina sp.]
MKKAIFILFIGFLLIFTAACGQKDSFNNEKKDIGVITVYTTVYPLTYFTKRIGGDLVEVKSIYPVGSNEHTFDPTQKDMMALADADLFFYIGMGLEGFVDNAKKTLSNEQVKMIATSNSVSHKDLVQEVTHEEEGTDEDDHAHENEAAENHDEHGHIDPHLWISPTISIQLAKSIQDSLIEKDPSNEETYKENFESLQADLEELDIKFQKMAETSSSKTFFVSHAAFGYLAGEYGLEQVAIAGLNSQDEPSQKELTQIVELAKEKQIKTILFEQNVSSNLAKVIQSEVGAKADILHNLSVLTKEDIKNEETYFTLMEKNLSTLEDALK